MTRTIAIFLRFLLIILFLTAWPASAGEPIKVAGSVQENKLTHKVPPVYPEEAKKAGIQGQVYLKVLIDDKGAVTKIDVVSGPKELIQASLDAVKQWTYEPTYLNGEPVAVVTDVHINYKLDK